MKLSPRETEILTLIAAGYSEAEVARALDSPFWTVHAHRRRIFDKLCVRSAAHMVAIAYQRGILGVKNGEGLDMGGLATSQAAGLLGSSSPNECCNCRGVRESDSTRVDSD